MTDKINPMIRSVKKPTMATATVVDATERTVCQSIQPGQI
jgi:hypothetical protein